MMKLLTQTLLLAAILPALMTGCSEEPKKVSYQADIMPMLADNCAKCHGAGGEGEVASGLNMTSYDSLMKGTKFGAVIKPGDSFSSAMIMLIEGRADPSLKMPHGDSPELTAEQVSTLKSWIDQGAKNN